MDSLQNYFKPFRANIVGHDLTFTFPDGNKKIIYADWAASGRLYKPIEDYIFNKLGPYVANTHTEATLTGTLMTDAYHQSYQIIKKHVNAGPDDQLLYAGFGMTAVVNKFQRIMGLRVPSVFKKMFSQMKCRPLVIVSHMEHHSNQTTWEESLCDVKILKRTEEGLPDLDHLQEILKNDSPRTLRIGAFTACSNVTGIFTPYHQMAEIMHEYGGYCFVDFAASAPYVKIDMHPENKAQRLDAIYFSPHKFLGGPGSSGVVVFNKELYHNEIPDHPGGGTVTWTNPWGEHHFYDNIEIREDGGTPGFLQAIKAALSVKLKEEMGVDNIIQREHKIVKDFLEKIKNIPRLYVLEPEQENRLGYISFYVDGIHHNLIVRILNDKFGIQTRGGCVCAGTYGHVLLNISYDQSQRITQMIDHGDLSLKPGWVRVSLHPTMTDDEVSFIADSIKNIVENINEWDKEYQFDGKIGDYVLKNKNTFRLNLDNIALK